MAAPRPKFSLTAGSLASDTASSVAGPSRFVVQRSLDVPLDGLSVMLSESGGVAAGDPVQLKLGDEDGMEDVFTGTVAEVRPRLGGCRLFCVGKMLELMELRVSSFYRDQTAGAVVRDLVGQTSLQQGDIADGISLPRFSVERRASAHAQLRRLADRLGYALFSDRAGKVHFRGLGPAAQLSAGGALGGAGAALAGAAAAALGQGGGGIEYGKHLLEAAGGVRPALGAQGAGGGRKPDVGPGRGQELLAHRERQRLPGLVRRRRRAAGERSDGADQGHGGPLRGRLCRAPCAAHRRDPADRAGPAQARARRFQRRDRHAGSGIEQARLRQGDCATVSACWKAS